MSATLLVAAGPAWGAARPDGQDDCHPGQAVVVYNVIAVRAETSAS
jgi:hypothetical protein